MKPDYFNALLEFCAALFVFNNCWLLYKQKLVRGVSIVSTVFFFGWGTWNTWWFRYIEKPCSFWAGLLVMAANCLWVGLMLYYKYEESHSHKPARN